MFGDPLWAELTALVMLDAGGRPRIRSGLADEGAGRVRIQCLRDLFPGRPATLRVAGVGVFTTTVRGTRG